MNSPSLILITLSSVTFSSCSTVQDAAVKAFGSSEPKLRLTKADPKRFLPKGTSADSLYVPKARDHSRLLAKHDPKLSSPDRKSVVTDLPTLDLPPLPEAIEDDNQEFTGILPSLDGSKGATYIDVEGPTPELPPLNLPEFEHEQTEAEKPT